MPPDTLTVSQFCDQHELLDRGKGFSSELTPYLRGVMDAFTDPEIEQIWFPKPTQIGGTRAIFNMVAYLIVNDPDDAMIVYPTLELAEYNSKNRLQPMIEASPVLRELYLPKESTDLELHFSNGMILVLAGANSPASLASRPIRYLFFDEVDKYPLRAKEEASPIKLALERTRTYPHNKKIVGTSTPTFRYGNVWRQMEQADVIMRYEVPCPHCGRYQEFSFKQIKWPEGSGVDTVCDAAYYQCGHCQHRITDADKREMVALGKWVAAQQRTNSRRLAAFHMNCIASPWLRFGEIAREFLSSKDDLENLQNFINSWLAEPFEQTAKAISSAIVLERQTTLPEGIVPSWAMILSGGVDWQPVKGIFYWTIRAWGPGITSQNIAHGAAMHWSDVARVMNIAFQKEDDGGSMMVNLCAIDSGDDTDFVEEIHLNNPEWTALVKGASHRMNSRYTISQVNRPHSKANGCRLVMVNTGAYKDLIAGRLQKAVGKGSWMVHAECDAEYAEQISSEHKVPKTPGSSEEVWRPKTTTAANHYLDAEVYAAVAAEIMGARLLEEPERVIPPPEPAPAHEHSPEGGQPREWLQARPDWLRS